jgi:hypothetical protein
MKLSPHLIPLFAAVLLLPVSQMLFQGCVWPLPEPDPGAMARVSRLPKALVYLDGAPLGVAPITIGLKSRGIHQVSLVQPGFEPLEIALEVPSGSNPSERLAADAAINVVLGIDPEARIVYRHDSMTRSFGLAQQTETEGRDVLHVAMTSLNGLRGYRAKSASSEKFDQTWRLQPKGS